MAPEIPGSNATRPRLAQCLLEEFAGNRERSPCWRAVKLSLKGDLRNLPRRRNGPYWQCDAGDRRTDQARHRWLVIQAQNQLQCIGHTNGSDHLGVFVP